MSVRERDAHFGAFLGWLVAVVLQFVLLSDYLADRRWFWVAVALGALWCQNYMAYSHWKAWRS